ncbi:hypothetical protein [Catenovulum sediminis]|uniref:Homeodomain-like domain-containing protein n=1 Tax=Catenovulum sediminis TaxID=1740262 RepID=A0ABV1RD09_9ALTE|nr:hypothetical protein [Catenovulum sediminis]
MLILANYLLEYAKLMVDEGYSNRQVEEIAGAGKSTVSRWKQRLGKMNKDGWAKR